MARLLIQGGVRLNGEVEISGFKNAALPVIPATLLAGDKYRIENLPLIDDAMCLVDIMKELGADIDVKDGDVNIDTTNIKECRALNDLTGKLRASYYLLGAGLGRFKKVEIAYPGGCDIGSRPIDQHIKGFEALGAKVEIDHGIIRCSAERLIGTTIYLDVVSVGATINIMMAAVMAEGTTIIENAAKEPHIVDTSNLLNAMGADIKGAGTDVIKITGVKELHGCTHNVIPDQIEAGTYMIASAATKGDVTVKNIIPKHLEAITAKLREMGVEVIEGGDFVRVIGNDKMSCVNIKTLPYPGFPTDLQQPMTSLLTIAKGTSIVTEDIFEGRFKFTDELKKMGANIRVDERTAVIEGVDTLSGAIVKATDLRAGAALVIAGLMAEGETEVQDAYHIYRGYEDIEKKLTKLGAKVERIEK
ncbi:UDP-N-acetylglucosamine 1-carboxyvinyltransferase MurA [Gottschalkia acidurici 9a]|uniref:UDP-N-acetylglucosamine 1-carboxyvinyltransferase n=1 Tax=Gottschalkia acidurici (strain ATCC 7906 / DSM 604 / BCRC 14475 / CIP 104303 / KCTC 5404 / NCIMB 10678 / 9a) TaxID=1128398 RepID=K0B3W7_GOTA9|nr:UDP-N-acetylglucosamine 1-carboxyvinyltransferase [Gottschalkia acidurici]AFS79822.1 UDP-N-acetylglucosamine 1-carboxyvinyltransferase MurA [Gottschalkia acidurici 9a]